VTWVFADHHDATVPADDLALLANFLDTRSDLHGVPLLVAVRNSTPGEVVGGELYLNLVARQNADVVHTHLSGDMSQDFVAIFEFDSEHGVRKRFDNGAFKHNGVFFRLGQGGLLNSGGQKALARAACAQTSLGPSGNAIGNDSERQASADSSGREIVANPLLTVVDLL